MGDSKEVMKQQLESRRHADGVSSFRDGLAEELSKALVGRYPPEKRHDDVTFHPALCMNVVPR